MSKKSKAIKKQSRNKKSVVFKTSDRKTLFQTDVPMIRNDDRQEAIRNGEFQQSWWARNKGKVIGATLGAGAFLGAALLGYKKYGWGDDPEFKVGGSINVDKKENVEMTDPLENIMKREGSVLGKIKGSTEYVSEYANNLNNLTTLTRLNNKGLMPTEADQKKMDWTVDVTTTDAEKKKREQGGRVLKKKRYWHQPLVVSNNEPPSVKPDYIDKISNYFLAGKALANQLGKGSEDEKTQAVRRVEEMEGYDTFE